MGRAWSFLRGYTNTFNLLSRYDEALKLLKDNEPNARDIWVGDDAKWLGNYLARTGHAQFSQAEAAQFEAYPLLLDGLDPDDELRQTDIARLVDLYTAWDAAEPGNIYDTRAEEWGERLGLDPD